MAGWGVEVWRGGIGVEGRKLELSRLVGGVSSDCPGFWARACWGKAEVHKFEFCIWSSRKFYVPRLPAVIS